MYPLRRPESTPSDLPASGAWRQGDPPAWRNFLELCGGSRCFALEGGGALDEITVAYETWGELDASASNAILVCHAVTGDAHAAGPSGPGQPSAGWWNDLIGPGLGIDTDRYFVVCINVLGGCQGSTGPSSPHPEDGKPYGARFPVVSVRDIVRTQKAVADSLGVDKWMAVIGGSMGGMQVLEWATMYPERVGSFACIASAPAASAMQIGWSEIGRLAIVLDEKWNGGDYYDADPGQGPHEGLMLARRVAQIHYRSDESLENRFGRSTVDRLDTFNIWDRFQVESYLDYHGEKLVRRFDANSYIVLNKAMDLHDIGRGRGGISAALGRAKAPSLIVSVPSDALYTPRQQIGLYEELRALNSPVEFETIESEHGHDGFLIEYDRLNKVVERFLDEQLKAPPRNT